MNPWAAGGLAAGATVALGVLLSFPIGYVVGLGSALAALRPSPFLPAQGLRPRRKT